MDAKSRKLTFEEGLAKLESIIAEMEEGKMGLEKMLKKFGEGMKLAKFCSERLENAEKKVEILVRKQDGSKSTEPFQALEPDEERH